MIVKNDWENNIEEKKCESCGYVYKVDLTKDNIYEKQILGDEDFIELGQTDIVKDKGGWHQRIEKITLYACPKCGCVHIKV